MCDWGTVLRLVRKTDPIWSGTRLSINIMYMDWNMLLASGHQSIWSGPLCEYTGPKWTLEETLVLMAWLVAIVTVSWYETSFNYRLAIHNIVNTISVADIKWVTIQTRSKTKHCMLISWKSMSYWDFIISLQFWFQRPISLDNSKFEYVVHSPHYQLLAQLI